MVAGGAVEALALQHAVLPVEAGVAGLLAAPALEAVGADARSGYRVAFGPVAALTPVGAVGPPEVTLTAWTEGKGVSQHVIYNRHHLFESWASGSEVIMRVLTFNLEVR